MRTTIWNTLKPAALLGIASGMIFGSSLNALAQTGVDQGPAALVSPTVPPGPRPTATVTPLQSSPEPTATVTPLASADPQGTQPQTSNTVAPSPSPKS